MQVFFENIVNTLKNVIRHFIDDLESSFDDFDEE